MEKNRIFVVGDVHGQLNLLKALEDQIKNDGDNYQIILTGDLMDRGCDSYQTFLYVFNNPKISSILGNHDDFFIKDEEHNWKKLDWAIINGGEETFDSILRYYNENPEQIKKMNWGEDLKLKHWLISKFYYEWCASQLFMYPKLVEKAKEVYSTEDQDRAIINFLHEILISINNQFKTLPYIMLIEHSNQKYVLTHSGAVATRDKYIDGNKSTQIVVHTEKLANEEKEEILWARDTRLCKLYPRKARVNDHIVLHGHTPKFDNETYIIKRDGKIAVVNLDGGAGYLHHYKTARLRAIELGSNTIYTVDKNCKVEIKQI
ncbi:MAG: metallophosphoesterase [Firmicutes bacterium]|nr:metallophosphoesterase [Bacillota bacterium]